MKTLRLIGMAIVAIIMSVNFAACGDDDDDEENANNGIPKKFISAMDDSGYGCSYEYDNQGRIIKAVWTNGNVSQEIAEFTYEENKIIRTDYTISSSSSANDKWITNYELKNGIIVSMAEYNLSGELNANVKYNYDSSKQLVSIEYNDPYTGGSSKQMKFVWQDGNIVSIIDDNTIELSYTSLPYQFIGETNNHFDSELIDNSLYTQGFYGKCCKNLVKAVRNYEHYDYIYTTDKDGYVTKVIMEYEDGDQWAFNCSWE